MPIKITVLSGSQQDETIEFDQQMICVGHGIDDDVQFHLEKDSEVRGQSIRLQLDGDRWILRNNSRNPLFINHDMVRDSAAIRSGDIIRMSYDGPDLLFELVSKKSQSRSLKPTPIESANTTVSREQAQDLSTKPASTIISRTPEEPQLIEPTSVQHASVTNQLVESGNRKTKSNAAGTIFTLVSIPAGGFAGICIAIVLLWVIWRKDPLGIMGSSDYPESQSSSEVDFRPDRDPNAVVNGQQNIGAENLPNVGDRFEAPGQSDIKSRSRNRSPVLGSIPTQEIDLSKESFLRFKIPASDPDQPGQTLRFSLRPGAPKNVQLDPNTGEINWEIDRDHPAATVSIPFQVSDDGTDSLSVQGEISINIVPADRWKVVENYLLESLYLVVAQPSLGTSIENSELRTTYLVLGTGVAVDTNRLLTSATVAKALTEAKAKGWQLYAYSRNSKLEEEPQRYQIRTLQVHAIYANATTIADKNTRQLAQAYFDLAVLTLDHETPSQCKLGIVAYPLPATEGVACIGFSIEGTPTSNPTEAAPLFSRVNLIDAIPPPNQPSTDSRPPLLLQLSGKVADHPYGSVIVNDRGDVIGVYGFRGELPQELADETVHYAAEVTQAMAFLKGNGLEFWVSGDGAETGSSQQ